MSLSSPRKRVVLAGGVLALIVLGVGIFLLQQKEDIPVPEPLEEEQIQAHEVIGMSVEGRDIEAYTFGGGDRRLLFVGGVHGGYEWNSVLLAYEMIDYFSANAEGILDDVSVSIIPSLNPDGVYAVLGKEGRFDARDVPASREATIPGRFNARGVDLNRNFDCKWQPTSTWRGETVSAGTAAFSEPEARALRDFVVQEKPEGVIFWHSKANAVYASECEEGILPETRALMNTYANAAGYRAIDVFDAYEITGDAEGWLASIGLPAITVELSRHDVIEWEKNIAGVRAVIKQ